MPPTSLANTTTDVKNAYNQGQQLQNMYNSQSGQLFNQYQGAQSQANNSQSQLQNYAKQISDLNYGNIYGQDLSQAQQMYGFNPQDLLKANLNLARTNTTLANLPQAIQQQGNYYGTTAGSEAANYSNLAGNLNSVLQGQTNQVGAYQNLLAATQQQANQQTTQQLAGQGQALTGYQAAATNAAQIMQNAQVAMNQVETLAQNQGYATAQQVAAYQNAYNGYLSAQAALQQASAAQTSASAQAGLYGAQQQVQQLTAQQMRNQMNVAGGGGLSVQPANGIQGVLSVGTAKGNSLQ